GAGGGPARALPPCRRCRGSPGACSGSPGRARPPPGPGAPPAAPGAGRAAVAPADAADPATAAAAAAAGGSAPERTATGDGDQPWTITGHVLATGRVPVAGAEVAAYRAGEGDARGMLSLLT